MPMKYCRFQLNNQANYGLVESVAGIEQITRILVKPPHLGDGDLEDLPSKRVTSVSLSDATLLAPVEPSKIVCIGRNYGEHAAELGHGRDFAVRLCGLLILRRIANHFRRRQSVGQFFVTSFDLI